MKMAPIGSERTLFERIRKFGIVGESVLLVASF